MNKGFRVRYQTYEFDDIDIHLCTLRDRQQYYDPDKVAEALGINSAVWPLFGVVWPSSLVLAHHIKDKDTQSKKILEIGCGIAVTSHLLNQRGDDITAMDYHPCAGTFLERNTILNDAPPIPFDCLDWNSDTSALSSFDLIIGSDISYEAETIKPLAAFINQHANSQCEVIIVDAGRGHKAKLSKALAAFGFAVEVQRPADPSFLDDSYKGYILSFQRTGEDSVADGSA